jgi:pimeloyl-ACP methyl ester carboxylesterase
VSVVALTNWSRYWAEYNHGLTRLTDKNQDDVVIAKGCGHFIQTDDPAFVATEILRMLGNLGW